MNSSPKQTTQGVLPFGLQVVEDQQGVTGRAGLLLVMETMLALGVDNAIKANLEGPARSSGYTAAEKVAALVLLMASGGDCLDDIRHLQADEGFCRLLGRKLPSADTLRNYLYTFHDESLIQEAQKKREPDRIAYIPEENEALKGLAKVVTAQVRALASRSKCTQATLDHDATIQESHKVEAQPHYKGGHGYQPAAIYWGEEDLIVADEYRDGNVPAAMQNLPLIQRGFAVLPPTVKEFFFRADSACYDEKVLKWLSDSNRKQGPKGKIEFTISADMTEHLRKICQAVPEKAWTLVEERIDETVVCSDVEFTPGDWDKNAYPLRYVALRIRKKQGQLFASGFDTKYLAVVSNRRQIGQKDLPAADLLRWHWQKAGTIEFIHDVTKNELAAAVPPCGRFGANAAWYRLSLLTYNILSAMKSLALPSNLNSARPKRLRFTVFSIAGRIISHAGQLLLRIGEKTDQLAGLSEARRRLLAIQTAPSTA